VKKSIYALPGARRAVLTRDGRHTALKNTLCLLQQANSREYRIVLPVIVLAALLVLADCGSTGISPNTTSATTPASTTTGEIHEYPLPQDKSGLMRPVSDHRGRIWFGEMGRNALAVFDPHSETFQQSTPPHGAFGIMGIAVAGDDTIWFAEQYANYIGHYDPVSGKYTTYDLPVITTPDPGDQNKTLTLPTAPNDIAIDAQGNAWFTEMNADALGMLDTRTGQFRHYAISDKKSVQTISPYGITIDAQGMVWFSEASTNNLGRLDPRTGSIHHFTLHGPNNPLMELASDTHGNIWATTFHYPDLLKFDPVTETFTSYPVPALANSTSALYDLAITPGGTIWTTLTAANEIARFDMSTKKYTYYQIPTESSLPLGITQGADHTLWFTESAANKLGVLKTTGA